MDMIQVPAFNKKLLQVIIETPKGSQGKYNYDPELKLFRLKKFLPMGMVFPFDFGFIPNTKGQDGDPLDVIVMMDEPAYPGCLVECRLLGVLKAKQKETGSKEIRNDRFLAVADVSISYEGVKSIQHVPRNLLRETEEFFVDYNTHEGKKFTPVNWSGAREAGNLIKQAIVTPSSRY